MTSKLQDKPLALKREHPVLKINFFLLFSTFVGLFSLLDSDPDPDTDPGTPLNPDPIQIRIRIRIHNTGDFLPISMNFELGIYLKMVGNNRSGSLPARDGGV